VGWKTAGALRRGAGAARRFWFGADFEAALTLYPL
jgi:hypothetical protein